MTQSRTFGLDDSPGQLALLLGLFLLVLVAPAAAQDVEGNPPESFESVWCIFLDRAEDAPSLDDERAAELQRQHLAHLGRMKREGLALVSGPFEAPVDERTRGVVLLRGDLSIEEVQALAAADPAVIVGWFAPRILRWWTPAGAMRFPEAEEIADPGDESVP